MNTVDYIHEVHVIDLSRVDGNIDLLANWEWELVAPSYKGETQSFQCLFLYSYKSGCTETLLESGQNIR